MRKEITEKFGGRLRLRACGILLHENKVLMVKHRGLGPLGYLWLPPGGGVEYQSSVEDNLKREFLEETGLQIEVERFLFVNEFHSSPLHAVELFFKVRHLSGDLKAGADPELAEKQQIIEEVRYFGEEDFKVEKRLKIHSVLQNIRDPNDILKMKGYFQNWK